MTLHQKEMGARFLSLRVKIAAFWLGKTNDPQKVSIKKKYKRT
jgi:hypothetical protein